MKFDFNFHNPTKIYFGKTALDNLSSELANYGDTVLLMYGKNAVKKIGLYDKVIDILNNSGKKVIELAELMAAYCGSQGRITVSSPLISRLRSARSRSYSKSLTLRMPRSRQHAPCSLAKSVVSPSYDATSTRGSFA